MEIGGVLLNEGIWSPGRLSARAFRGRGLGLQRAQLGTLGELASVQVTLTVDLFRFCSFFIHISFKRLIARGTFLYYDF